LNLKPLFSAAFVFNEYFGFLNLNNFNFTIDKKFSYIYNTKSADEVWLYEN